MSYQVLARKWRPHNFTEMVGQAHVLRALVNALEQQRLHHAYLFTGTRGVGKTTIARILAKSLNCEQGVSAQPCGICAACREINEGRFVDLIEVDAASRTKVEDTRELLDNVQYAPTRGRYKVYLIDEVHMLSGHSFNALLKTLEEPPPHVKFLLATTDPQKLPATILSRCLQFNLKRMPPEQIEAHLQHILNAENVPCELAALKHLARAADGSMRDALSLLDQAIAYGHGSVKTEEVQAMLGHVAAASLLPLLQALADRDAAALMQAVEVLQSAAPDFESALNELLVLLHQMVLGHMAVEAVDESLLERESLLDLAQRFALEDLQLYYQIGLIGKRDLILAPTQRSGFEMILLRMLAFTPLPSAPAVPTAAAPVQADKRSQSQATPPVEKTQAVTSLDMATGQNWQQIVQGLNLKGMVAELAQNCALKHRRDNELLLSLPPERQQLFNKNFETRLAEALAQYFGQAIKLKIEVGETDVETPAMIAARLADEKQQTAVRKIEQDNVVRALQEKFAAEVHTDAIRTLDS